MKELNYDKVFVNGTVVELRDGRISIVIDGYLVCITDANKWRGTIDYNKDLTSKTHKECDIVAVSYAGHLFPQIAMIKAEEEQWDWVREETTITKDEGTYLDKALSIYTNVGGYEITVTRKEDPLGTYLDISIVNEKDRTDQGRYTTPYFKNGEYKKLKKGHAYHLRELIVK